MLFLYLYFYIDYTRAVFSLPKTQTTTGIPAVPPGFGSEGWGWGEGRRVPESPLEWHSRFLRAKEAMGGGGQIAGSPVLLAAQALLARCRETRLLSLPRSAEEIRSSR